MKKSTIITFALLWINAISAYALPNQEQKIYFNTGFCLSEMLNFCNDAKEVKMISGNLIVLARLTSNDRLVSQLREVASAADTGSSEKLFELIKLKRDAIFSTVPDEQLFQFLWGDFVSKLGFQVQIGLKPESYRRLLGVFESQFYITDPDMFAEIKSIENNLYGETFSRDNFIESLRRIVGVYSIEEIP